MKLKSVITIVMLETVMMTSKSKRLVKPRTTLMTVNSKTAIKIDKSKIVITMIESKPVVTIKQLNRRRLKDEFWIQTGKEDLLY